MLAASKTYFVGYKDDVLAWQLGTSDTVLDVSPSGAAREVSLSLPKGFVLADLVPSDDEWVVHVQPTPAPQDGAANANGFRYFEFLPSDGSLLRQLVVSEDVASLACKSNRRYDSFTFDGKDGLVQHSAE